MPAPNSRKQKRNERHPHNPTKTTARKDRNVKKSSHGIFKNVAELVEHQKRAEHRY